MDTLTLQQNHVWCYFPQEMQVLNGWKKLLTEFIRSERKKCSCSMCALCAQQLFVRRRMPLTYCQVPEVKNECDFISSARQNHLLTERKHYVEDLATTENGISRPEQSEILCSGQNTTPPVHDQKANSAVHTQMKLKMFDPFVGETHTTFKRK